MSAGHRELGGPATGREMNERAIELAGLSEAQQAVPHGSDGRISEIEYRLNWARTYLKGIGGVEGARPAEQAGGLPGDLLQHAVAQQPYLQPAHVAELPLGIPPAHLAAACCLVEKRQHLGAQQRRGQDLMAAADHGLVVRRADGDVRADHVPGHGRSVPLGCGPTERLPRSTGMPGPLIGIVRSEHAG